MSWKDIMKNDFPSEKYARLVKVIDDRFGNGAERVKEIKEVYDDRPSGKPMTDDEFVRAYIKNEINMADRQKDFTIDGEKYIFELKRILGEI
tara:strand:- start:1940 stop:2215 length:276 start_codon:yes stop_codon:yes gene_type:complete